MGYIGNKRSAVLRGLVPKSQLKDWQKRAVDSGAVKPREWRHTGEYYNSKELCTMPDCYDLSDFECLNPNDFRTTRN